MTRRVIKPAKRNHRGFKQGDGYEDATCAYGNCNRYAYKADNNGCPGGKWRPSIHMPREAARLFLTLKNVRV
ncbi:MAG: hypothetical protein PHY77_04260, partial [Desulfotomaculaceae bacterium]|nr:hypothetical protein [Desulfotomaculaceae bacterium]